MTGDVEVVGVVADTLRPMLPVMLVLSIPAFMMFAYWLLRDFFWGFGGGSYGGGGGGGGGGWEPPGPPPVGPEDHGLDQDAIVREAEEVVRQAEREIQGVSGDQAK